MYTIIDLCLLCLTNNKNLKSISSRDSDGILVEEKLRFFLFELGKVDPEILKQICLPCLEKLNYIYNYKQQCLRNIDKLNTYKYTLNTRKERCTNLQVQFDTNNLKENQIRTENENSGEPVRSENFNLDNVIVKNEPSEDDTETKFGLQGEHGPKPEIEQLLNKDIVMNQKPDHNSDNNKVQKENAITGIEDTNITVDEVKFEFVDVLVKDEPEDFYDKADTRLKLCDLKEKLQNAIANNAGTVALTKQDVHHNRRHQCTNLQVQFDTNNLKENQIRTEYENSSEPVRSENFNLDNVIVKNETSEGDTEMKYVLQGKHEQKRDIEEFRKEDGVVKKELDHNSDNNKAQEENAITGIEETKITEDEIKFEFVDELVKEEPEDLYNETDTCSKLCDLKKELQNETANNAATSTANENITKIGRPYKCNVCNRAFPGVNTLRRHEKIHSNARPFKCLTCNKTFTCNQHLIRHERIHNNIRPYKCSVCSKAFTQSNDLIKHERIHTGEKPYKCNVCNRAFAERNNLTTHERIHNNVRLYKCSECNKEFTRNSDLTRHIMRIHKIQSQYKCTECNKEFTRNSDLTRHIMRIHKIQ